MTDEWKASVRAELRHRGMSMEALAHAINVHKSTVIHALDPRQRTSGIVEEVSDYLGLPHPLVPHPVAERSMTIAREIADLPEPLQEAVLAFVRAIKEHAR